MNDSLSYPGRLPALQNRFEDRPALFDFDPQTLTLEDVDMVPLRNQLVPASAKKALPGMPALSCAPSVRRDEG